VLRFSRGAGARIQALKADAQSLYAKLLWTKQTLQNKLKIIEKKPRRMNNKLFDNWAGLVSIIWLIGGFLFISCVLSPHNIHFEPLWLYGLVLFLVWLGVGLLFAIAGLRRGNSPGRICAVAAIGVFIFLCGRW
jgi:hypothetical protein